jgi:hypothetical protein
MGTRLLGLNSQGLVFFALNCVTASIAHFVSFEVLNLVETLSWLGSVAAVWPWSGVAVFRMETVIYVAVEALGTMKPGARAKEDATGKPLRAVVAVGGAVVRRDVIVAVRADRRDSDIDLYLSMCFGSGQREADCSNRG